LIIYKPGQDIFTSTAYFLVNPVNNNKDNLHFAKNHKLYQEFVSKTNPKGGDVLWYHPEQKDLIAGERGLINICIKDGQPKTKLNYWTVAIKKIVKQIKEVYSEGLYPTPLLAISIVNEELDESELLKAITTSLKEIKFDVEIYTNKLSSTSKPIEEIIESK
jgi:hypothetical protein